MSRRSQTNSSVDSQSGADSADSQSPIKRKETLRSLLTRAQAISQSHDISSDNVINLERIVKDADEILRESSVEEKASCRDEVVMDSHLLAASSQIFEAGCATITKNFSNYDYQSLAEMLLRFTLVESETILEEPNWSILQAHVPKLFFRTPGFSTLLGAFDIDEVVAVKRQRARATPRKDPLAPTRRPEAVITIDDDDQNIEATVKKILRLITNHYKRNNTVIDYFSLVLHPTDFGKTVENMLHVSFLVRDGVIEIIQGEGGSIAIMPSSKEKQIAFKREKKNNTQNVITMNVDQWKILVQEYRLEKPMIDF